MFDLLVKDNFFPDVRALRADVLSKPFSTVKNPTDEVDYTGIQKRDPAEFQDALSALMGFPVRVNVSVARMNFENEVPNQSIHADHALGEFASVGYLNISGPATGTAFWTDKRTGLAEVPTQAELVGESEADFVARIQAQADDTTKWVANAMVFSRPGRLIVYPCRRYHSRWPFAAFGNTPETARLVLAIFFSRA